MRKIIVFIILVIVLVSTISCSKKEKWELTSEKYEKIQGNLGVHIKCLEKTYCEKCKPIYEKSLVIMKKEFESTEYAKTENGLSLITEEIKEHLLAWKGNRCKIYRKSIVDNYVFFRTPKNLNHAYVIDTSNNNIILEIGNFVNISQLTPKYFSVEFTDGSFSLYNKDLEKNYVKYEQSPKDYHLVTNEVFNNNYKNLQKINKNLIGVQYSNDLWILVDNNLQTHCRLSEKPFKRYCNEVMGFIDIIDIDSYMINTSHNSFLESSESTNELSYTEGKSLFSYWQIETQNKSQTEKKETINGVSKSIRENNYMIGFLINAKTGKETGRLYKIDKKTLQKILLK